MRPLNLYVGNILDLRTQAEPISIVGANKLQLSTDDTAPLYINNNLVYQAGSGISYSITIGASGLYQINDSIILLNSTRVGYIANQGKTMSDKQIQLQVGNIDSISNKVLNLTGAIKATFIFDSANTQVINGITFLPGGGIGPAVITLGDDKTIINDQLNFTGSTNVGYIIERLI